MDTKDLDIFICTHKDFKCPVTNDVYKVLDMRNIDASMMHEGIKNSSFYSEIIGMMYVRKNLELKKYVGFCQYRRYFSFMDDIPDMDEICKEYDCVIAKPIKFNGCVREQYAIYHNEKDLDIVDDIIREKFKDYYKAWFLYLNGSIFIPYNMFIMKKEDFIDYIDFIEGVLNEYIDRVGSDIEKRIEDNKEDYIKDFPPSNSAEFQYRVGGYLAERLTPVFMINRFKSMKPYMVKITQKKNETISNGEENEPKPRDNSEQQQEQPKTRKRSRTKSKGESVQDADQHTVRTDDEKKATKRGRKPKSDRKTKSGTR